MHEPSTKRKYSAEEFKKIGDVFDEVRRLAESYHSLTGCHLGITGEIAEYEAAFHLGYELWSARTPGFDLTDPSDNDAKYQVKGYSPRKNSDGSISQINQSTDSAPWDYVLLVILDNKFRAVEIFRLSSHTLELHFANRSQDRVERGEMPAKWPRAIKPTKFKSLANNERFWPR